MKSDIKGLISIITFFVILFSGCSGNRYPDILIVADSIADTNPKKALTMLDSISAQMSNADEAVKNYYDLLRIKASDKAYIPHKSDTTILRLVDYYEIGGDKNLLPLVYYYAGRINFDLNNAPEALEYFQGVLDVTSEVEPLKYKAYSQMGYVFLYQDLYDNGIKAFKEAYEYNKKRGNISNQIYELCGIGDCYKKKNDYATASKYYQKALVLSEEVGNSMMQHSIFAQLAKFHYTLKEYSIAEDYIRRALKGVDGANLRNIYAIAVTIYKSLEKKDSVFLFCKKLYEMDDIYAKQFASKNLSNYFLEKSDISNALFYLKRYENFSDSLQSITQTQGIAKINALYNYQLREKENIRLKDEIKEKRYTILIISFIAIVSISLLSLHIMYVRKKRQMEHIRSKNLERILKEQFEQSKTFIETNVKRIKELDELAAGFQDEENATVSKIQFEKEQLSNMNKLAKIKIENKRLANEGIESTEIYKKITNLIDYNIDDCKKKIYDEDWKALDIEVNKYFPDFRKILFEMCKINEYEYKVCLLIKINIPPVGISVFMNKTKSAISLVRKRLYKKVFNEDVNPNEWDEFIRSL